MFIQEAEAKRIAELNDEFRKCGYGVLVTKGVQKLDDLHLLLDEIKRFKDFNEDNDPYGEHDFGTLHWYGEKVFWKIDYYDDEHKAWHNPIDTECRRIITLMLASEY